jgi:hypothetical protein
MLLHREYFSKRFLPSLPSTNIQFKFDPRVLGHSVYPNSKCDLLRRDDMNAKLRLKLKRS